MVLGVRANVVVVSVLLGRPETGTSTSRGTTRFPLDSMLLLLAVLALALGQGDAPGREGVGGWPRLR